MEGPCWDKISGNFQCLVGMMAIVPLSRIGLVQNSNMYLQLDTNLARNIKKQNVMRVKTGVIKHLLGLFDLLLVN